MQSNKMKTKAIDLGALQSQFELATKEYHASEKALARAQETRDKAKASRDAADAQLRNAARSVLG